MADLAKEIIPVNLEDEMRRSYLDYAMSVIVGRALPDVRDGLKPVHRRVLFAMNELGAHSNKPYYKSAHIVGDVIGKYHPHGDIAVYDTIVRMAQDFSLRHMLVDGQGNFGSVDGDNAAAMRYTEIRLSKIAHEMLADIDKETVDFGPNYDGSEKSCAMRTMVSYTAMSPCGWYLPITSPTIRADFLYARFQSLPSSCMANNTRRCTGLRPSRASGRARPTITLIA